MLTWVSFDTLLRDHLGHCIKFRCDRHELLRRDFHLVIQRRNCLEELFGQALGGRFGGLLAKRCRISVIDL